MTVVSDFILILYYSRNGSTRNMAIELANGVESTGMEARLRTVPSVSSTTVATEPEVPAQGAPYANLEDLSQCSGLLLGSPTRFGNMAAPMKHFLDQTSNLWLNGDLVNKPAGVFTSTSTLHGGQESTLLSMITPLLHHGLVITGLPFTEPDMHNKISSSAPYGLSRISTENSLDLTPEERRLAQAMGKRIAMIAKQLSIL